MKWNVGVVVENIAVAVFLSHAIFVSILFTDSGSSSWISVALLEHPLFIHNVTMEQFIPVTVVGCIVIIVVDVLAVFIGPFVVVVWLG